MSTKLLVTSTFAASLASGSYSPFDPEPNAVFLKPSEVWHDDASEPWGWSEMDVMDGFYHGFWPLGGHLYEPHLWRSFYLPEASEAHKLRVELDVTFVTACGFTDSDTSFLWYNVEYSGESLDFVKIDSFETDPDGTGLYSFNAEPGFPYASAYCPDGTEWQDEELSVWANLSVAKTFWLANHHDNDATNGQNNVLTVIFGAGSGGLERPPIEYSQVLGSPVAGWDAWDVVEEAEEAEEKDHAMWGVHSISLIVAREETDPWGMEEVDQQSDANNVVTWDNWNGVDQHINYLQSTVGSGSGGPALAWWAWTLIGIACLWLVLLVVYLVRNYAKCLMWRKRFMQDKPMLSRHSSDGQSRFELVLTDRPSNLLNSTMFNDEIMSKPVWDRTEGTRTYERVDYKSDDSSGDRSRASTNGSSASVSPKKRRSSKKSKKKKNKNKDESSRFNFSLFNANRPMRLPGTSHGRRRAETSFSSYKRESLLSPQAMPQPLAPLPQLDTTNAGNTSQAEMDDLLSSVDSLLSRSKQSSTPKWTVMTPQKNTLSFSKLAGSLMAPFSGAKKSPRSSESISSASQEMEGMRYARISSRDSHISDSMPSAPTVSGLDIAALSSHAMAARLAAANERSYARVRAGTAGSIIESNFDIPDNASELSDTDYQNLLFETMAQQDAASAGGTNMKLHTLQGGLDADDSKFKLAELSLDPNSKSGVSVGRADQGLNTISEAANEPVAYESYGTSTTSDQGETDHDGIGNLQGIDIDATIAANSISLVDSALLGRKTEDEDEEDVAPAAHTKQNEDVRPNGLTAIELMREGQAQEMLHESDNESDASMSVNDRDVLDSSDDAGGDEEHSSESDSVLDVTDATNLSTRARDLAARQKMPLIAAQDGKGASAVINGKKHKKGRSRRKSSLKAKFRFKLGATPEDETDGIAEVDDMENDGGNFIFMEDAEHSSGSDHGAKGIDDVIHGDNENGDEKPRRKISMPSFNMYRHMKSKQSRFSLSTISDL